MKPTRAAKSATRPWVDAFAGEMEAKLAANRHKGDRDGWRCETAGWLMGKLKDEVDELQAVLMRRHTQCSCGLVTERDAQPSEIRAECADIANFAMMIADVAGGLRPSRTRSTQRRRK